MDGIAVCEKDGGTVDIPLSQITGIVREGDVLCEDDGNYSVDVGETNKRRADISARFEAIKNRKNRAAETNLHIN